MPKQSNFLLNQMERAQMRRCNRRSPHPNSSQSVRQVNVSLLELLKTTLAIIQNYSLDSPQGSIECSNHQRNEQEGQFKQSMKENHRQQMKTTSHLSIDKWKVSKDLIPNYSTFSPQIFKNILCKAVPHYREQLEHHLADSRLLSYVQQYTHLFCMLYQLEMEKDYWKAINDHLLCAMNWLRKMSKDLTKRYLIDWNYPRTEKNLRHRQRLTENKITNIIPQLELHFHQYAPLFIQSTSTSAAQIMLSIVSEAAIAVLKTGLQQLENNFTQKKLLMKYDAKNIELLKSFYDSHPTEREKIIFQKLWRMQYKSGRRIVRQEENISFSVINQVQHHIPFISNPVVPITAANIHQFAPSHLNGLLSMPVRNIIEAHQQNIIQRANQILQFKNSSSL